MRRGRGVENDGMTLRQRIDPRLHLAAAIGWAVFAVVMLAAVAAANLAATEAGHRAQADTEALLSELATQAQDRMSTQLEVRRLIVQSTAAQIMASNDRGAEALRRHLEAVQAQFKEFVWLGVADERGRIVAATQGLLEGQSASGLAFFRQTGTAAIFGTPHPAPAPGREGTRVIDVGAPLVTAAGVHVGAVGAYLDWSWVQRFRSGLLRVLGERRQLDLLLLASDGTVLTGASPQPDPQLAHDADCSQAGRYLVGRAGPGTGPGGSGWSAIVRQPVDVALAPARVTQRVVLGVVLLCGLLAALAAAFVTGYLTRRLATLAREAEAVRRGSHLSISVPKGEDEVSRIGATLAAAVARLQEEKQMLVTLNAELDARVVERTARVEVLAEGERHAAVTRERLRLARDLHDTLAHSLMALLTQIRLIRKLHPRLDAAELDAELASAETVTRTGLDDARAAITQMRANSVREVGLVSALTDLLARFGERTGIAVMLDADAHGRTLADERSEPLFRIVEEALRNVERHARAQHVAIALHCRAADATDGSAGEAPARIRLTITDDGVGFDTALARPGHYGLLGLGEQAALMGAVLTIDSAPGRGTRVGVEFTS